MENEQQPTERTSPLKQLENFFDLYLHKKVSFHLPENVKEFIVKYGPWIDLVFLVLAVPIILTAFAFSFVFLPFATITTPFQSGFSTMHWIIILVSFLLKAYALPGLFRRSLKSGWYFAYYAVLVSALGDLLSGNLFGFIIGTSISLYFLFQVKEKYK